MGYDSALARTCKEGSKTSTRDYCRQYEGNCAQSQSSVEPSYVQGSVAMALWKHGAGLALTVRHQQFIENHVQRIWWQDQISGLCWIHSRPLEGARPEGIRNEPNGLGSYNSHQARSLP